MRDFLDNLIERHVDAAPQIVPRLPLMFEPEISHGGLDLAIEGKEAKTPEETETLRQPSHAAQSVGPSTVAQQVRPLASPAPTVPVREVKPSMKVGLNESAFLPLPPGEGGGEGVNSISDPLTLTLSRRERGLNERLSSAATVIAPVTGKVRHAHHEERMEHTSPNLKATAQEQPSVKESLNKPVFSHSPQETLLSQGGGVEGVRGLNQELLKPSATLIVPVIPSVVTPERPISQSEPVINVTIGRIEVRATVSSQKQTPKPESQTPVMGLEEYLRRRSGGHDR